MPKPASMSLLRQTLQASAATAAEPASAKAKAKATVQPKAKAKGSPLGPRKRGRLDLDDNVDQARAVAAAAKKALRATLVRQKNEQRKAQRPRGKAAKLPPDDLLRIAIYKRINVVNSALADNVERATLETLEGVDDERFQRIVEKEQGRRASFSKKAPLQVRSTGQGEKPEESAACKALRDEKATTAEPGTEVDDMEEEQDCDGGKADRGNTDEGEEAEQPDSLPSPQPHD